MALTATGKKLVDIMLAQSGGDPGAALQAVIERRQEGETLQQVADRIDALALMVKDLQDWGSDVSAILASFITAWNAFAVSGGNGTTTDIAPLTVVAVPDDHKYTDDGSTEGAAFPAIS